MMHCIVQKMESGNFVEFKNGSIKKDEITGKRNSVYAADLASSARNGKEDQ